MLLDRIPREVLVAVAVFAVLYALLTAARGWLKRARVRRRFERGLEGEREAAAILVEHGYTVEGAQVTTSYVIDVDGAPVEILLRADYVVSRGGERYVAEVKTGRVAPSVQAPATRRQLLEYHLAFAVAGVLLVDADARSVHRIAFPAAPGARDSRSIVWPLVVTAIVVAVIAAHR